MELCLNSSVKEIHIFIDYDKEVANWLPMKIVEVFIVDFFNVSLRLIYIVITSLCGFDIDSPTPMARIGRLSPTWVVRWTLCSSHVCRL